MASETTPAERRWARILYVVALAVVLLGAGLVATLGFAGIGIFGLIGTAVMMVLILTFAVGG